MDHTSELREKFEQCVEACADSMYRVAFRLTGNATLARELVQESYLSAWRSIGSLEDPKKMRSWMFAILRNQHTKLIRSEKKSVATSEAIETASETPDNTRIQIQETVQAAVSELDDKHRMAILLVSMEGLSVEEAAKVLDVPRGTVLSRLSRGREKLKSILIQKQIHLASE